MYTQYYLQARDAADKIRQGSFEVPKTLQQPEGGFVPRRQSALPEKLEAARPDPQKLVLDYMSGLQENMGGAFIETPFLVGGEVGDALSALAAVESSGNYYALGPVMKQGSYEGDRAYGKYQVMGRNIPQWTQEILGKSMTPDEFLADPNAQDAVAAAKMQASYEKYGTWEDAASVWFTGRPLAKAGSASDGYINVQQYVTKFRTAMSKPT